MSLAKLGAGAEGYYLDTVARGTEEYYLGGGEAAGRWRGAGCLALALDGEVGPDDLRAVLSGFDPRTGDRTVPANRRVPGFDLTFSAPKSVSLLHGLGSPEVSAAVVTAHEAAVDAALAYLEREACRLRRGHNGVDVIEGKGFVAAGFRHRTSRAGDPQLHTHVLVANMAHGADGRWGAL
ncbi:MAG: conjugal transfer protein (TraA-like protein), partial [Acidimicrobiales bacterium]|nr:conjugal transfer protein (TraA-like protein) [Acidimicrobiales bacterium]